MLFEPGENISLEEGLEITCQLVSISYSSCKVNIFVRNTMHHDITMPGKTVIGSIQMITYSNPVCPEEHKFDLVVVGNPQTLPNFTTEKSQSDPGDKL